MTWAVPTGTPSGRYPFTVTAQDNGTPSLASSLTFSVLVADARPIALSARLLDPGQLQLTISGNDELAYTVEASTDLINWSPVGTVSLSQGIGRLTQPFSPAAGSRFFRVLASP